MMLTINEIDKRLETVLNQYALENTNVREIVIDLRIAVMDMLTEHTKYLLIKEDR